MKILLIGDYSMVHKNLKDGLEKLGHTVILTSDGDSWKKLPGCDLPLTPKINLKFHTKISCKIYNKINRKLEPYYVMWCYLILCLKNKFDVIHIMSADLFHHRYRKKVYKFLMFLSRNKLFVSIPGDDCYIYEAWKKKIFRYFSFDDNINQIKRFDESNHLSIKENEAYRYTVEHAKALIPLTPYDTEEPFKGLKNLRKVIQLPFNCETIKYTDNVVNNKIIIYHGISYPENKGSNYILEALDYIKENYSDSVEIVLTNKIPFGEFINTLNRCNIYVDQCKSYSYGMSSVIAMAMGKIVMSGKEPEIIESLEGHDCPVINIIPNTKQIVLEIEKLIKNRDGFVDIGKSGRKFVEEFHDCKFVANRYVDEWNK